MSNGQIFLALLLAHVYGVLGVGFGIALAPFLQNGLPGPVTASGLAMLVLATASFAPEVALFLAVFLAPTVIATLPLTDVATRWITLLRWSATLLGVAFVMGFAWPLGAMTMGGGWDFPGRSNIVSAAMGGACLAQPIWRRCMRPRRDAAAIAIASPKATRDL